MELTSTEKGTILLALEAHKERLKKNIDSGELYESEQAEWEETLEDNRKLKDRFVSCLRGENLRNAPKPPPKINPLMIIAES